MLPKNGDFIFRASVISNSCGWQKVAEIAHFTNRCAIDLPSSVPWHGVDQFLASKIYPIGFKQPNWRYSSRPFCHSSSGPLAVGQLDALDRASNVATVGLLIAVTLSTRHRSPLGWLR